MDVARTSPGKKEVLVRMTWVRKCHVPYVFTNQKKYLMPSILFQANVKFQINPSLRPGIKLRNKEGKTVLPFCPQLLEIIVLFYSNKIFISCPVWGKLLIRRSHLTCCVVNLTEEKICCDMAKDTENVTCVRLAFDSNKDLSYRCKNAFWKCCIKLHGEEGNSF